MSAARTGQHRTTGRIVRAVALFAGADLAPWTGPVERRDPDAVRQRSVHLTWRCAARWCRQWTMNGAYKTGRCNFCGAGRVNGES